MIFCPLSPTQSILHCLVSYHTHRHANTNMDRGRCVASVALNCDPPRSPTIVSHSMLPKPTFFQFPWNVIRSLHIYPLIRLFWVLFSAYPIALHYTGLLSFLSSHPVLRAYLVFCSAPGVFHPTLPFPIAQNSNPLRIWILQSSARWRFVYFTFLFWSGSAKGYPAGWQPFTNTCFAVTSPLSCSWFAIHFLPSLLWFSFFGACIRSSSSYKLFSPFLHITS